MRKVLYTVRKFWLIAALVGLMGVALAACGGDTPSGGNTVVPPSATTGGGVATVVPPTIGSSDAVPTVSSATTPGTTGTNEYQVTLKDYSIEPRSLQVSAGKVKFIVTNAGATIHNLVIPTLDKRTPNFESKDGPQTLEIELVAGAYKWICDIPGHAERGMTGEVIVK